ncbi:MAG: hypothetical protein ACI8TX_003121 [Hyphomicrobiaceae bacterium]|jgi:hypothetical protein
MNRYLFYGLCAAGLLWRLWMITHYELVAGGDVDVYLADEGIVGLMGKHILEGKSLPVFFYGQHYLGALEAYCAAISFSIFGVSFLSLRLVTLVFSVALCFCVYRFTYRAYSVAAARWATALTAVAPMYFLQWNLKARGGFVEHLVLVFALLILFWRFYARHERGAGVGFALGFVAGVALWVNQLVGAYLALMVGLLAMDRIEVRAWIPVVVGALLGASLLLGYNVIHPLATPKSLARKAMVLNRVAVEDRDESWVARGLEKRVGALRDGAGKLGLVFGVPAGTGIERLGLSESVRQGGSLGGVLRALWFVPALIFGVPLLAARPRRWLGGWERLGPDQLLLSFFVVTFVVGYVSPRYMLPAYPLAGVLLGVLVARQRGPRRNLALAAFFTVVGFNLVTWADAMTLPDSGVEARGEKLLSFLDERDLGECYSAGPLYHLAFRSVEGVILAPLQKDRYPEYDRRVEVADNICYVFRDDQQRKAQHKAFLDLLQQREVSYQHGSVADYNVFWDFRPREALDRQAIDRVRRLEKVQVDVGDVPEG